MQLFKHMEVVLMLAFGILCATVALKPAATGQAVLGNGAGATFERATMPTVHVVGRRLTPAEKRAGADNAG